MTGLKQKLWMTSLICGTALALPSAAHACNESEGYKVVFASGPFASAHPRGSMLCGVDEVSIATGDFVVLRRGERVWRFQRAGRYKLGEQDSQPLSVLAVLARYMNTGSWGVGSQSRNGAVKALNRKPEDDPSGGLHPVESPDDAATPAQIRLSRAGNVVMAARD